MKLNDFKLDPISIPEILYYSLLLFANNISAQRKKSPVFYQNTQILS